MFQQVFAPHCNDEHAYRLFALRALLNALAPLIGAETSRGNKAVSEGWADDASPDQISEWSKQGNELVLQELEDLFQRVCAEEYRQLIHKVPFALFYFLAYTYMDASAPCTTSPRC